MNKEKPAVVDIQDQKGSVPVRGVIRDSVAWLNDNWSNIPHTVRGKTLQLSEITDEVVLYRFVRNYLMYKLRQSGCVKEGARLR
jgi:hypothetical protein